MIARPQRMPKSIHINVSFNRKRRWDNVAKVTARGSRFQGQNGTSGSKQLSGTGSGPNARHLRVRHFGLPHFDSMATASYLGFVSPLVLLCTFAGQGARVIACACTVGRSSVEPSRPSVAHTAETGTLKEPSAMCHRMRQTCIHSWWTGIAL
ncbi:hypothetical protein FIBSPDRAFT_171525 [Athelia psychrophila]|uniref:Uncharacterized protein n=1 Tax=Athelia psychrophila TaxID=1759441 RepID=A0A166AU11_9AGAM|nr:hypothetical protein FIBSPDRAFT_171525 [Fibularhizoctonia sp. CBS 109695]